MHKRSILAATVITVAAAVSGPVAAASAATVTPDAGCYLAGGKKQVGFTLAGFPASATVTLAGGPDNSFLGDVTADAAGGYRGQFEAASLGDTLRATYYLSAYTPDFTVRATAPYTLTQRGVGMVPAVARAGAKVRFRAGGFIGGRALYAHYFFTRSAVSHPHVKTVKLGALKGACGDLDSKRVTQLPLTRPKPGVYVIQFDTVAAPHFQKGTYTERSVFVPK